MKIISIIKPTYEIVCVFGDWVYWRYKDGKWTYIYADIEHEVELEKTHDLEKAYQEYKNNQIKKERV